MRKTRRARRSGPRRSFSSNRPRRRARRAFASNAPRRRSNPFLANYRRRSVARRSNPPDILGFNLKDIAYAGAAVVAAPFVEKQVMSLLPVSMAGTTVGRWGVKIGSAALIGYGAKRFLSTQAGNLALIALGANLVADAVAEFAPAIGPGVGLYANAGMGRYVAGNPARRQLAQGPVVYSGYAGASGRSALTPMTLTQDPFAPPF